jgi:hypothetical protein
MKIMKRRWSRGLVLMMSILFCGATTLPAETDEPGPFERLFRAIRHAGKEPKHKSEHRDRHKQSGENEYPANAESSAPATSGKSNKPPGKTNTRSATRAEAKKGSDFSYGTPVPGKPGLVTSPYSPNSGYIDVRGFAPGTPVKDPYTGKIFLTP